MSQNYNHSIDNDNINIKNIDDNRSDDRNNNNKKILLLVHKIPNKFIMRKFVP